MKLFFGGCVFILYPVYVVVLGYSDDFRLIIVQSSCDDPFERVVLAHVRRSSLFIFSTWLLPILLHCTCVVIS